MQRETTRGVAVKSTTFVPSFEMRSRDTLEIPAPLFGPGERIMALNRRARGKGKHTRYANPGRWEAGVVECVIYEPGKSEPYRWSYKIVFDRRSYNGHPLRLTVIDDEIRPYEIH